MTIDFAQVVSSPPSGRTTALIIDHAAYAQQVLLRGAPMPWLDETAYVSLLAQAEGLLKPDVTLLDTGPVLDALLAQDSSLVAAMGARTRVGYALRTLLAHEGTAERLMRVVSVVSRMSRLPLVLQVPGPVTLAARAHVLAGAGEASDVTADHAENLSVYLADWLRRFSSVPVSLLLLDGRRAGSQELDAEDLTACTPVLNAA
ncbi:MAG: hypothetical protein WC642_15465, partial [Nocardioides sp.]